MRSSCHFSTRSSTRPDRTNRRQPRAAFPLPRTALVAARRPSGFTRPLERLFDASLATGRPASGRPRQETVATELHELAEGHSQRAAWEWPRAARRNITPASVSAPPPGEPLRIAACRQPLRNSPASASAWRTAARKVRNFFMYSRCMAGRGCAGAKAAVERRRSLNQPSHFLPQPLEHAALGEENGV